MPAKTVEVIDIAKRFGTVDAVRPLSLKVEAGEFLTLLGPSGCGKTTLLRMIAGLEQVSGGSILVGGADVTAEPPNRRDTSIMFQDYALFPHKSVADNIGYGLKMRGMRREERAARAGDWLERIGLPGYGDRLPHQLSGGQRQRVALARALILEPGVLLLDEPLGALDAGLRRQLQGELRRLHRDVGLTFIAVTHDQEEAITMSDRIAVMREGAIEQLGNPEAIYDRPRTEFVARFIGRCNVIEGTVAGQEGDRMLVDTKALGRVLAAASASRPTGKAIKLAVRPEAIEAVRDGGVPAKIREVVFAGAGCRVDVTASDGSPIEMELDRRGPVARTGEMIAIAVRPGAATILEETP